MCFSFASSAAQSCLTLCDARDGSPPGSSVHGLSQARMLEWVVLPFSRGFAQPRDRTCVSCIGRWILYHLSHQGSPVMCNWGKFWTRHKETKSPTATFEELEARAGRRASPRSQHHKRAGRPPKPPSGQLPYTPLSSPRIRKQLIPLGGGTKGTCFCSHTPLLQQGPSKALPEFLVWPPVDFY